MFKPNLDLYKTWEDSERLDCPQYIAVFRKGGKTLLYVADRHAANISFDMVDFCFGNLSPAMPEIAVIEYENADRKPTRYSFQDNTIAYAGAVAAKRGLPVVYADLSKTERLGVLNAMHPERKFTMDDLDKVQHAGGPSSKSGELKMLSLELNQCGRDPFMLRNIAAALDKYDVVLAVFGEGHYRSHRLVLIDMMGEPEYIKSVPNVRGNFDGLTIDPVKLI